MHATFWDALRRLGAEYGKTRLKGSFISQTLSMHYDYKTLYEKSAAFYHARPRAKKALLISNPVFTWLFFFAYAAFLAWAVFSNVSVYELVYMLALPALCLVVVGVLRMTVLRPRPYSKEGANITPILKKENNLDKSFPSRHVACAFVISTVVLAHFLWAGIPLFLCAVALGYIRFALGLHYPSDLLGGAAIGLACGIAAFFV